jgi:hypothetical protein
VQVPSGTAFTAPFCPAGQDDPDLLSFDPGLGVAQTQCILHLLDQCVREYIVTSCDGVDVFSRCRVQICRRLRPLFLKLAAHTQQPQRGQAHLVEDLVIQQPALEGDVLRGMADAERFQVAAASREDRLLDLCLHCPMDFGTQDAQIVGEGSFGPLDRDATGPVVEIGPAP